MDVSELAKTADPIKNNNCLIASTSIIIRSLLSQFTIPILYTNEDIHYISTYDNDTHKELYTRFGLSQEFTRAAFLYQSTFLKRLLPSKFAWFDFTIYTAELEGKSLDDTVRDKINAKLARPSTSNLKVITLSIDQVMASIPLPKVTAPWKLVAMQCMEPKHFFSIFSHHNTWYNYNNMRHSNHSRKSKNPIVLLAFLRMCSL